MGMQKFQIVLGYWDMPDVLGIFLFYFLFCIFFFCGGGGGVWEVEAPVNVAFCV